LSGSTTLTFHGSAHERRAGRRTEANALFGFFGFAI
jgi:hypothetical protein